MGMFVRKHTKFEEWEQAAARDSGMALSSARSSPRVERTKWTKNKDARLT